MVEKRDKRKMSLAKSKEREEKESGSGEDGRMQKSIEEMEIE